MKRFLSAISAVLFLTSSLSASLPFFNNNDYCGYGELKGDSHFKIYGDYLYWQVSQDQMAYAAVLPGGIESVIDAFSGTSVNLSNSVSIIEPDFEYTSGFRIGIGYDNACLNWDVALEWTRFHNTFNSCVSDCSSFGVIPITIPIASIFGFINRDPSEFMFGSGAKSQWKFQYDAIDLKLGRAFLSCNCLILNPYIGVKAARIKQQQEIDYSGFTLDVLPPIPVVLNNIKKNQFRGIGPSVGVEGSWEFWSHFNLKTAFQAALLYGKFNVKEDPTASVMPNMVMFELSNTKRNRVRPTIDASIGLDWDYSFCGDYGIELGIGYEVQYWWNQWQATSSFETGLLTGGTSPQGDLSMQGLTVRAAFLF